MENKQDNTYYKGCLLPLIIGIVLMLCCGLMLDARRALGRYIYAVYSNVKVTFVLLPQDDKLVLSIYDCSVSPIDLANHIPIAQYYNFQSEYISDAFYCGFRARIYNDSICIWMRPYAKELYAHNSKNVHFTNYIPPRDSICSNIIDVDLDLGTSKIKIYPKEIESLTIYELPWYKIIINKIIG